MEKKVYGTETKCQKITLNYVGRSFDKGGNERTKVEKLTRRKSANAVDVHYNFHGQLYITVFKFIEYIKSYKVIHYAEKIYFCICDAYKFSTFKM